MDDIWIKGGAVLAASLVMLGGMWLVFERLKAKDQGFGPNSLRALGIVLFIPALVIVGITFPGFRSETIAALFGTVAGYVLSQATRDQDQSN